jgi:hypothetical protein
MLTGLVLTDCDSGIVLKSTKDSIIANCRVARTNSTKPDLDVDSSSTDIGMNGNQFTGVVTVNGKIVQQGKASN